ncbi:hypothetical protein C9374_014247 [Naegleria lovaniensis]|uniref:Uncharacterized protein n=1 Tax=Naegleria lovaniensis TaxID=51637 RepID=A0AA88KH19_NAELO|nr:uncharacterized protein C9374_014247 [Naegleria lovaniensis]KAG2370753.1 hypothetical protein C9374_014247 [Naegleria lovaniensis]
MPIVGLAPFKITRATQKYHTKFGFEIFSCVLHMMRTAHKFGEPEKSKIIKEIKQKVRKHKYEKNREKINDLMYDLKNAVFDLDYKWQVKTGLVPNIPKSKETKRMIVE